MAEKETAKRGPSTGGRQHWIDWLWTVLGMVASLAATSLSDAKEVPQYVQVLLGSFVLVFTLLMAVARRVTREPRAVDRLKVEIQGSYMAALKKSPFNPMREQMHHAE